MRSPQSHDVACSKTRGNTHAAQQCNAVRCTCRPGMSRCFNASFIAHTVDVQKPTKTRKRGCSL